MALNGSQKFAILLCKFSDSQNVISPPVSFFEELLVKRGTGGLNDYWSDSSQGKINLDGSEVFDWKVTDQTKADFMIDRPGRWDKIVTAITTFPNVNISKYAGVIAIYNVNVGDAGNAGNGVLAGPDDWNITFLAHETGHTFGLQHSFDQSSRLNIWWSAPGEYFDMHDIMSAMSVYSGTHPKFGQYGPLLNAANLERMSWLDPARIWTQPTTNTSVATFELVSLGHKEIAGYLAAKIGNLYIEFRTKDGWDGAIPRPAVLIHQMPGVNSVVMASDKTNYVNDWQPGQIYGPQDTEWMIKGGIRISIDSFNLTEKKAKISMYQRVISIPNDGPVPDDWHIYENRDLGFLSVEKSISNMNHEILETRKEIAEVRKELFEISKNLFKANKKMLEMNGLTKERV